MGNIGYMCEDYAELCDVIVDLARNPPTGLYQNQQQNILRGRSAFEPRFVAPKFREIIEGQRTESHV